MTARYQRQAVGKRGPDQLTHVWTAGLQSDERTARPAHGHYPS